MDQVQGIKLNLVQIGPTPRPQNQISLYFCIMKTLRLAIIGTMLLCALTVSAQRTPKDARYVYTEASELNLIGKIMPTPNPYHRVDTVRFKGFTPGENFQVRCPAGLAVVFRTNSSSIKIIGKGDLSWVSNSTMRLASHGYDLYIKRDGKWVWARNVCPSVSKPDATLTLIKDMDTSMKECLLYLPIYCDMSSIRIGVEEGSTLEAIESPFRHRVAIFGSSYTHGISTSRAGMSYPAQFTRRTGIQMLSLGCSGNCKMQPYFADVLAEVEADAFVFDAFSNPDAAMIQERLFPFIERMRTAHPGKPLIFQQTITRENRNFNHAYEDREAAKQHMADSLMRIAVKRYPDVYFVQTNASDGSHEWSVDGIHPDDYGYYLWTRSIEKPILRILRKYGIK